MAQQTKKSTKKTPKTTQKKKTSTQKKTVKQPSASKQQTKQEKSRNLPLTSMIMGIIGLVLLFLPFLGIVFSVLAIVFAVSYRKQSKEQDPYATAGLVMGIIGTAIHVFFFVILLVGLLFTANMVGEISGETVVIESRDLSSQEEWQQIVEVRRPPSSDPTAPASNENLG
jgi:flagellar biosynthesis protein FlhB